MLGDRVEDVDIEAMRRFAEEESAKDPFAPIEILAARAAVRAAVSHGIRVVATRFLIVFMLRKRFDLL